MRIWRSIILSTAVAGSVALAGCSSSGSSDSDYVNAGNTLCNNVGAAIAAIPKPSVSGGISSVETFYKGAVNALTTFQSGLKGLKVPAQDQDAMNSALATLQNAIDTANKLESDASSNNGSALSSDATTFETEFNTVGNQLDQAGLFNCKATNASPTTSAGSSGDTSNTTTGSSDTSSDTSGSSDTTSGGSDTTMDTSSTTTGQ